MEKCITQKCALHTKALSADYQETCLTPPLPTSRANSNSSAKNQRKQLNSYVVSEALESSAILSSPSPTQLRELHAIVQKLEFLYFTFNKCARVGVICLNVYLR